jgi:hypothetical protein
MGGLPATENILMSISQLKFRKALPERLRSLGLDEP